MIPAAFDYYRASSIEDATSQLAELGEEAKFLAGGHSLIPFMRLRFATPVALVDISEPRELCYVRVAGGRLRVGALTRHRDLEASPEVTKHLPLLALTAGQVGDTQVRNRGTIGGAVAHADPAGEYATLCLMLDADIVTTRRTIPAQQFFLGHFTTPLEYDEVIVEISFPVEAGGHAYVKFGRRLFDWAVVGVAVQLVEGGVRIGLVNVGETPMRAVAAERAFAQGAGAEDASVFAAEGLSPSPTLRATSEYKLHLVRVLTGRRSGRRSRGNGWCRNAIASPADGTAHYCSRVLNRFRCGGGPRMSPVKGSKVAAPAQAALLQALQELGFSQYEARCYIGLLNKDPQTGYSVAKSSGVPQPKVYEALRKLASRGAAHELAGSPTRFLPTPPSALLDQLESGVVEQLGEARRAAAALVDDSSSAVEILASFSRWPAIVQAGVRLVEQAQRRLYVSASAAQLADLTAPLRTALDRGVDVVVLCFGDMPFEDERIKLYRHLSTEGVIYRSHQARHLALIADSSSAVWALADDGRSWSAIETTSRLVIAALKGFIRHDIDMQQVFDDFGPELIRRYGPGLEALERYRQVPDAADAGTRQAKRRRVG